MLLVNFMVDVNFMVVNFIAQLHTRSERIYFFSMKFNLYTYVKSNVFLILLCF